MEGTVAGEATFYVTWKSKNAQSVLVTPAGQPQPDVSARSRPCIWILAESSQEGKTSAMPESNPRQQRGLVIAATCKLANKGDFWVVPSSTGQGKYYVRPNREQPSCTCPDHQECGHKCKHIFAVELVIQRELFPDGSVRETRAITMTETVVKKPTYKQEWRAYNAAQTSEKAQFQFLLRDLCAGIQEPPATSSKGGRPRIPLKDGIFAAVFKVFSTLSGRRFMSDLRDAHDKGHVNRVPSYNSIFRVLESEAVTPLLIAMIVKSAGPLKAIESSFACDSTGFSGCRFDRWYDKKYGGQKVKRAWVKAHVMCGTKTNVITAVEIHDQNAGDCPQLPVLLATTGQRFTLKGAEVSADMAYSAEYNLQAIVDAGASPLIPFKRGTTDEKGGLWAKAFHYFSAYQQEFMARYHQRSNVESTFSMVKAKFGDACLSKTDTAMRNEVLCKFLSHNLCCLIQSMHEFGVDLGFGAEVAVASKLAAN